VRAKITERFLELSFELVVQHELLIEL
jgi:hypothetical protein